MPESRFVLDTNAVIFLTTKGNIIPSNLLDELNEADLFISAITEIELFAKPDLSPNEADQLRAFFADRIPVIDLTKTVKLETITLRRNTKLKLPDCIIAATAIALNAVLLTADAELLHFHHPGYTAKTFSLKK